MKPDPTQVLLAASAEQDARGDAREKMFVLLYDELHARAARLMRHERPPVDSVPVLLTRSF